MVLKGEFPMNKLTNINLASDEVVAKMRGMDRHPVLRVLAICALCLITSSCAVQPGQQIPAFLPMADSVALTEPLDIDGVWRVNTIDKRIRIEGGRAYAVDDWLHLFTLHVMPNMVVIRNIQPDGMGGYTGEDLPLMGKWQAKPAADGALDIFVAGALGPASYRLLPVELDSPGLDDGDEYPDDEGYPDDGNVGDDGDYVDEDIPDEEPAPAPGIAPIGVGQIVGNTVAELGKNCYEDFKPMGGAMLKYLACQAGLGNINALNQFLLANKVDDAKNILAARACMNEFNNLVNTVRQKGFKSLSLGVSGELGAIIGGSGEAFIASNLDLSSPTIYGSLGAGVGSQVGGGVNGVVSVYYDSANKLSGKGKSFSVSLKAFGGAGGAVGISSGPSPRCESFSATAGAGAEVNAGSVSATRTFKLVRIPKPDFSAGCKDVSVKATNRTGKEIKIIDVDFYDYINKRWRSKIIRNQKVSIGKTWSKKLRLQKVGGDKTKIRVQYRVRDRRGLLKNWSDVLSRETGSKVCSAGITFSTVIK